MDVIVDHEGCYLDTVTVTNVPGDIWETGDEPRLKIVLRTDEGYIFASGLGEDEVALDEETGIPELLPPYDPCDPGGAG